MSDYNIYNPDESLIRKQLSSVSFSYYTDVDVRNRSVVSINNTSTFDIYGNPIDHGLYDLRMGPYQSSSNYNNTNCPTCHLSKFVASKYCTGHFGHIDLFVPVYQPILFMDLLVILRCQCWYCHTLLLSPIQKLIYTTKFIVLLLSSNSDETDDDNLNELLSIDTKIVSITKTISRKFGGMYNPDNVNSNNNDTVMMMNTVVEDDDDIDNVNDNNTNNTLRQKKLSKELEKHQMEQVTNSKITIMLKEIQSRYIGTRTNANSTNTNTNDSTNSNSNPRITKKHWTTRHALYYKQLVKECISICRTNKNSSSSSSRSGRSCYCCGLINPTKIRHDQHNKIFISSLSTTSDKYNYELFINSNSNSNSNSTNSNSTSTSTLLDSNGKRISALSTIQNRTTKHELEQQQQQSQSQSQLQGNITHLANFVQQPDTITSKDLGVVDTTTRSGTTNDHDNINVDNDMYDDYETNNNNNVSKSKSINTNDLVDSDTEETELKVKDSILHQSNDKINKPDIFVNAAEIQAQLQLLYENDTFLCNCLFGTLSLQSTSNTTTNTTNTSGIYTINDYYNKLAYQIYFMTCIAVIPNRFRPPMMLGTLTAQHQQSDQLSNIIMTNNVVQECIVHTKNENRAYTAWIELQTKVNAYIDCTKDPNTSLALLNGKVPPKGIRQLFEKKDGLFRKNMMGKRVNYCCRSVISPDPYVGTNEIGIPKHFATSLTYPTVVTEWNINELRTAVIRGIEQYPGARWVEISSTTKNYTKRIDLSRMNQKEREGVANQLLTNYKRGGGGMPAIVGRQLKDGDYVLMNRQPTLHKPGIMGHRVRVLHNPTQKTIRMHYANCNTYNADFDGDEMNCHYPQSDIARAEAEFLCSANEQFIVPTDGSPLRGLIQDHVVGGVQLTKADTFLERWEYQQLLFAAFTSLQGLEIIRSNQAIELMEPAILKPRKLWTGKQVISTILLHLRKGNNRDTKRSSDLPGISVEFKSKTPDAAGRNEDLVLIKDGELLRGVLDKNAYGSTNFSLVHAVQEAYGPNKAGLLLNAFGRLFTAYVQYYSGHSCRMEDLILTPESNIERNKLVQRAYNQGAKAAVAWANSEGGKVEIPPISSQENCDEPLRPHEKAAAAAKILQLLTNDEGKENFANLDSYMQSQLNPLASDIVKKCLPSGLAVPFPANTFSIMTTTGAKGSIVNQSQVSCALGQQALEGRRVPRMSSGRTLPSFQPYEPHPRADGFVMDRFLTGIRPQEYYFHCMAGREGLVDTAVKTSRSGYLQRCLIKHMEELKVCYDHTVRNAGGGVVQFLYGEDGLDPTKASYLDCSDKSFAFMMKNSNALSRINQALPTATIEVAANDDIQAQEIATKASLSSIAKSFQKGDYVLARKLRDGDKWVRGALCRGWYPGTITKVHSKTVDVRYHDDNSIVTRIPIEVDFGSATNRRSGGVDILATVATLVKHAVPDPVLSAPWRGHTVGRSGVCVSERIAGSAFRFYNESDSHSQILEKQEFSSLVSSKYSSSLCAPGEAVGCIAGQSVGEPSTQMTLNTFHLAGSGANVTLGIPRLREIIQTASKKIKTPTMSVPIHDFVSERDAIRLSRRFQRLPLMEVVAGHRGIAVTECLERDNNDEWKRAYHITLTFHPMERIKEAFGLSLHDITNVISSTFMAALRRAIKVEIRRSAVEGEQSVEVFGGKQVKTSRSKANTGDDEGNRGGNDDDEADEPESKGMNADNGGDDDNDDDDEAAGEEDGMDAIRERERREGAFDDEADDEDDNNSNAGSQQGDDDESIDAEYDEDENENRKTQINDTTSKAASTSTDNDNDSISLDPIYIDPAARPLLMVGLVESVAEKIVVRSKKNIEQAFINEEIGRGRCLQFAGMNFEEIWKLEQVNCDELMSNDTWAICCSYGIEAARCNIVQQIKNVFGAYGIEVDPRHLSLIADYMTYEGGYKAMNRAGMEGSGSVLLQMSFETTTHFMKTAATMGLTDELESPSANICVGKPMEHGTGSFAVLAQY